MAMTTQEQRILNAAVVALERTTGIHARVRRTRAGRNGLADAIVEIEMDRRKRRFGAEVKTVDQFETPAIVKARDLREPHLLAAPYITREVAERCRQLHLPFIDTAGNAYLEGTGLLVYVVGQARPPELHHNQYRALNPAGIRIVFALLCHPEPIRTSYREIAAQAGVALGTVGPVLKDLEARRFLRFQTGRDRKLIDPERMLERMGHALSHDSPPQARVTGWRAGISTCCWRWSSGWRPTGWATAWMARWRVCATGSGRATASTWITSPTPSVRCSWWAAWACRVT